MVSSRKILENTIAMGIYKLSVPLFSFLLLIFIAKTANVELLGQYSLVTTFFIILHVLPLLGLGPLVIRELAGNPKERDKYISNLGVIAIAAALIFNLLLAAIIYFFKYPPEVNKALFYVGLSVFPGALAFICECVFIASEKMKYAAGIALVENFLRALFSIIILSFGFGLKELFLVIMVLKFAVFGFYYFLLNRALGSFCFRVSKKMLAALLKHSQIFFPATILGILFARIDFLFLSKLSTFENLGFYTAAYRIVESVALLSTSFIIALSPVLARSYKESVPKLLLLSRKGVKYVIIFSLPAMIFIYVFSGQLIQLFYKDTYFSSVLVLRILSFSVLFFILNQFFSLLLVSTHHQKDDLKVLSFGAALYTSLLYIFISKWSIAGAAAATLLTMIFQCAARYFLISRKVGTIRVLELALRPVLAVLCVVVLFTHLSKSLNIVAVSCISALLYIFMIFVLKAISLRELRAFSRCSPAKNTLFNTLDLIRADIDSCARIERVSKNQGFFYTILRPYLLAVVLYRIAHYFSVKKQHFIALLVYRFNCLLTRSDINYLNEIGPGLCICSPVHIFIDGTIGSNAFFGIHSGVWGKHDKPTLGDNVTISSGANVFGSIDVGSGSSIKSGCFLTHSVAENTVVEGYPDRKCQRDEIDQVSGDSGNLQPPIPMSLKKTWEYICSDIKRYAEYIRPPVKRITPWRAFKIILLPNVLAIALYRFSRFFYLKRAFSISRIIWNFSIFLTGADISPESDIGKRFLLWHAAGNTISARFGENCTVYVMTGIGNSGSPVDIGAGTGRPWIGNNVSIAVKAVVLGPIRIGDNVKIAPMSLVMQDVPKNSVVSGNPAKITRYCVKECKS